MEGKDANIKIHKPLIRQHCMVLTKLYALFASVEQNFLKLDTSFPKWQATSDAARRFSPFRFF